MEGIIYLVGAIGALLIGFVAGIKVRKSKETFAGYMKIDTEHDVYLADFQIPLYLIEKSDTVVFKVVSTNRLRRWE